MTIILPCASPPLVNTAMHRPPYAPFTTDFSSVISALPGIAAMLSLLVCITDRFSRLCLDSSPSILGPCVVVCQMFDSCNLRQMRVTVDNHS